MKASKIVGWVLLFVGLAVISYSVLSSYNIFIGKASAPMIFKAAEKVEIPTVKEKVTDPMAQLEQTMGEKFQEELKAMIPTDFLTKILNLISWSTFALILIFAGTQISGLGIKLIKE